VETSSIKTAPAENQSTVTPSTTRTSSTNMTNPSYSPWPTPEIPTQTPRNSTSHLKRPID